MPRSATRSSRSVMEARAQAIELGGRHRHRPRLQPMRRVAVEIGAARHQQPPLPGYQDVLLDEEGVMVGMERLDRIEPGVFERTNPRLDAQLAGVRERG